MLVPLSIRIARHSWFVRALAVAMLLLGACPSCSCETHEQTYESNHELPNGVLLNIKKSESLTRYTGAFTGKDYGFKHTFRYALKLDDDGAAWAQEATEPKSLLFCPNALYLRSWRETFRAPSTPEVPATGAGETGARETVVVEVVEEFRDTRRYFGLTGSTYWVTVAVEMYEQRRHECAEFSVPSDGDLALTPPADGRAESEVSTTVSADSIGSAVPKVARPSPLPRKAGLRDQVPAGGR